MPSEGRQQGPAGPGHRRQGRQDAAVGQPARRLRLPGCAWPDRNHASTFEFCENGAKAVAAEATARRVTREFFAQHTVAELADKSDFFLEDQGRLTEPMVYDRASDKYLPIEWDTAFEMIAGHLDALPDPNQAMFYTSGRASNEAAFLYQLFVREYGTNNFPDCSNMCHEPSGSAMRPQIGVGKGTVTLDDFEKADAIFIFGQNPGTNHPRMLGELRAAAKRGARIVSFNPLRERGLERFARSAGQARDGDADVDPDQLALFPAARRRRLRHAQGHDEARRRARSGHRGRRARPRVHRRAHRGHRGAAGRPARRVMAAA